MDIGGGGAVDVDHFVVYSSGLGAIRNHTQLVHHSICDILVDIYVTRAIYLYFMYCLSLDKSKHSDNLTVASG